MTGVVKETANWFLRHNSVGSGIWKDRELSFQKQYPATHDLSGEYNTFLDEDYPSEAVYAKLFNSIAFILDPYCTAFEAQAGLVQKATDAKAITRNSFDNPDLYGNFGGGLSQDTEVSSGSYSYVQSNNFTTATQPHQLPDIYADITSITNGTAVASSTTTKNGIILQWLINSLSGTHAGKTKRDFLIKAAVDDLSIQVDTSTQKLETTGITTILTVVTGVTVDGLGHVTTVTTSNVTITKGVITDIS